MIELDLIHNELLAVNSLQRVEAQVVRSEYSASIARFAATLSHELNSRMGALEDALQTSSLLVDKGSFTERPSSRSSICARLAWGSNESRTWTATKLYQSI